MEENKNESTLSIIWHGDEEGKDSQLLHIHVGDQTIGPVPNTEAGVYEASITGPSMAIKIETGDEKKRVTRFNRKFQFDPEKSYTCEIVCESSNMGIRMSNGDEELDDDAPVCRNIGSVVFQSILFPIYGIGTAIYNRYNRVEGLVGAAIGFGLGTIISAMASDGDRIVLGYRSTEILEYEPFSLTDFAINLLIGGISSIRGFLDMMFQ